MKLLLYLLKQLQEHSFKIESFNEAISDLSQEDVEFQESNGLMRTNINVIEEICALLKKEKSGIKTSQPGKNCV